MSLSFLPNGATQILSKLKISINGLKLFLYTKLLKKNLTLSLFEIARKATTLYFLIFFANFYNKYLFNSDIFLNDLNFPFTDINFNINL